MEAAVGALEAPYSPILNAREGVGNGGTGKDFAPYHQFSRLIRIHFKKVKERVLGRKQIGICSSDGKNTQPNRGSNTTTGGEMIWPRTRDHIVLIVSCFWDIYLSPFWALFGALRARNHGISGGRALDNFPVVPSRISIVLLSGD